MQLWGLLHVLPSGMVGWNDFCTPVESTANNREYGQFYIIMAPFYGSTLVGKSRGLLDPAVATAKATAAFAELDLKWLFLAVQNSSIGDLVTQSLTD